MFGIVLTFEFGLNWGRFAHDAGSDALVLGRDRVRHEHAERLRGAGHGIADGRKLPRRGCNAPGEAKHDVHEGLTRAGLKNYLLGRAPHERGYRGAHAHVVVVERRERAVARVREYIGHGPLFEQRVLADGRESRVVEIARLFAEARDEVVDSRHAYCPNRR